MLLMTKEIERRIPPIGAQEESGDPIVHVKWFCPWNQWTWYCTEFDPAEGLCFGLVVGHETELGYWSLEELKVIEHPRMRGVRIERDLSFGPLPLSVVRAREIERSPAGGHSVNGEEGESNGAL